MIPVLPAVVNLELSKKDRKKYTGKKDRKKYTGQKGRKNDIPRYSLSAFAKEALMAGVCVWGGGG